MAQQNLRSVITIAGSVDSSFGAIPRQLDRIGNTLLNLGSYVDQFSRRVIDLGRDSLTEFADFDDLMRKIQSVSQMTDKELAIVESATREMGKTTRYTAEDAAEASLLLAQVGLNYKDIVDLLPDVLRLAQAGDMGIADASDYLYASLKSMGYGLEYADILIDQMAKTASIGATDVDTLGQSMTRVGSGLQLFKGGSSEVLAILSAMSQFGEDMRGQEGGTALRNFMLSLVAPSGNRDATVAMLENLGVSMEELDAIMEDVDLTAASKAIQKMGLEVYDDQGNLRGGIDIITSLRDALAGLSDEAKYNALSQVFGKRNATTAMNLIRITDEEWKNTLASINDSAGFADLMAMTQEGGIGGSIRLLKSQWEEFKLSLGEAIAPKAQSAMGFIGDMLNDLSGMDEGKMDALVNGLGAVAAAGPGILAVGGGLKFLAFLLTPTGLIAGGVVGLTALALALHDIEERDFKDTFGDMARDMEALTPYVDGLTASFLNANADIDAFGLAAEQAAEKYQTAAATLSSDTLTAQLTHQTLSEADKKKLLNLGDTMVQTVVDGIENSQAEALSLTEVIFYKGEGGDNAAFNEVVAIENEYYQSLRAEAVAIGADLRAALTEAMEDGTMDAHDREVVMEQVSRLNAITAAIAQEQNAREYEKMLKKSQSVSWDSFSAFGEEIQAQMDTVLAAEEEAYLNNYADKKRSMDWKIQEALKAGDTGEAARLTQMRDQKVLPGVDAYYAQRKVDIQSGYGGLLSQTFGALMQGQDYGDGYSLMQRIFEDAMKKAGGDAGALDYVDLGIGKYFQGMSIEQARAVQGQMEQVFGDSDMLSKYLEPLEGTPEMDAYLTFLRETQQITADVSEYVRQMGTVTNQQEQQAFDEAYRSGDPDATYAPQPAPHVPIEPYGQSYWDRMTKYFMAAPVTLTVETSDPAVDGAAYKNPFEMAASPDLEVSAGDPYAAGMAYGSSWAAGASATAFFQGTAIVKQVSGGSGGGKSGKSSGGSGSKKSSRPNIMLFAEGGRADEASVFAEAGPEWAIPEEHSRRTAELLDAARAASGFTWPELLSRSGGLGAGPTSANFTLIYAPTIQAADAAGVRAELLADKERLERWLAEKQLLEGRMAYQ